MREATAAHHWARNFGFSLLLLMNAAQAAEMPVSFEAVLALDAREPDQMLRYGSEDSQYGALWLPRRKGSVPLLVLVHGGCWLREYSAPHVYPLAAQLARDGFAVWVPEYRRVGERGGGWPGTAADVLRSLDVIDAQSLPGVNRTRTLVLGHSAGGHLALWLASRDPALLPPGLRISGAIGLAAITDLDRYARGTSSCQSATPRLMGAGPDEAPERYRAASPSRQPQRVPTVLLRGGQDPIVGPEQVSAMAQATPVHLETAGHFDWIHPDTPAYEVLRDVVFEVLARALENPGT